VDRGEPVHLSIEPDRIRFKPDRVRIELDLHHVELAHRPFRQPGAPDLSSVTR
jgi:hypothetical protein